MLPIYVIEQIPLLSAFYCYYCIYNNYNLCNYLVVTILIIMIIRDYVPVSELSEHLVPYPFAVVMLMNAHSVPL